MLLDFAQLSMASSISVPVFVRSDMFGYPCILAICSLVVHVMTSETFYF